MVITYCSYTRVVISQKHHSRFKLKNNSIFLFMIFIFALSRDLGFGIDSEMSPEAAYGIYMQQFNRTYSEERFKRFNESFQFLVSSNSSTFSVTSAMDRLDDELNISPRGKMAEASDLDFCQHFDHLCLVEP